MRSGTWSEGGDDVPKVVLRSGVKIHYQQIGEGPDLVMIHGLTATWRSGT